ncbi:MAG: polyketide cyclase [Chromatiaceae bacterium]|nr:MAG: polyketide cyclase [Chromatiaceae bacterium]
MVKAQASIEIHRPPRAVYTFIAEDFERNYPRWSPEVKELRILSKGPLRVGSFGRQIRVDQGRRSDSTFRITRMMPPGEVPAAAATVSPNGARAGIGTRVAPGRLTVESTSAPLFLVDYRLEPTADHTRLTFTFEIRRVELMMKPFEKLIRVAVQDGAHRTVRNLKRLIEADAAATTA